MTSQPSSDNPAEFWNDYFRKDGAKPSAVAQRLLALHKAGQHEQVIAAIRAALIQGRSQPWMYDVLALSLKIAGRPKEEIERVLLSRVDFSAADVPSMLHSAACLTYFGAVPEALQLCRQASQLEPTHPEPYVRGLNLAKHLEDYEAIQWAVSGILTFAWTKDHAQLHRKAENAALDAQQAARKAGNEAAAASLERAVVEARKRDLVLRLTWSGNGDLDLVVEEPLGTVCSSANPWSRGGGVLLHDGYGPDQKNCYEEYVCAYGIPGDYRVRITHVSGSIVGSRAKLTIVRYRGTPLEEVKTVSVPLGKRVKLTLHHGRRKELSQTP